MNRAKMIWLSLRLIGIASVALFGLYNAIHGADHPPNQAFQYHA